MTILTMLEIVTNYPDNILIETAQDKKTGKWVSLMYMTRDGDIHKLMLSFDISETFQGWDTEKEARDEMEKVVTTAQEYYNNEFKKSK